MEIPPDKIAQGQGAMNAIRRYRKSSSTFLLGVFFLLPTTLGLLHVGGMSRAIPSTVGGLTMLSFLILFVLFHSFQRRVLKKRSDEAEERLSLLRAAYGPGLDDAVKTTRTIWVRR